MIGRMIVAVTCNEQLVNGAVSGQHWWSLEDVHRYMNVSVSTGSFRYCDLLGKGNSQW